MSTQADVRNQIRAVIDDLTSPPSHIVPQENLRRNVYGDQVNGTNKFFRLNNRRLVANEPTTTTLVVVSDGTTLTPFTGYTEDIERGTFTITGTAPSTSLIVSYDFVLFLDAEYDLNITTGLSFIGYTAVSSVPDGLVQALVHKTAALALKALASRAAPQFDAGAGGKSITKSSIKKQYLDLAKYHEDTAEKERENFYKRQGRREAPAYGQFGTGQKEYTPKR